jgi:pilus assembly protein Flp/PilA
MMNYMKVWTKLKADRRGVTAMEYGIIAGLLALVIVAGLTTAGPQLGNIFTKIGTDLTTAAGTAGAGGGGGGGSTTPQ